MKTMRIICAFTIVMLSYMAGIAQQAPEYSVYLIGDTGAPKIDQPDPVFTALTKHLEREGKNSAIIFLGDNIYHNGLPPEDRVDEAENRRLAEKKLLVQLEAIDDFKGEIYFIPGNHDWNNAHPDGIDYIRAQEEYIEFFLDRGDVLIPDHGCPGPEKKKLGKNVVLIALDSQWWLHPHTNEQSEESDCKNKNTSDIIQELKELLDENDDQHIIVALHHPLYSDGSHNGYFTLKDHFFPLTALNKSLWIPLPVLGSLHPFYRSTFGVKQDMPHPLYQNMRDEILKCLTGYKNVVFASGHEHNLQYFYEKDNHFIKSGSGSKSSPLPSSTNAIFSDKSKGYAKLEYYESGEVKLRYFTVDKEGEMEKFNRSIVLPSPGFGSLDQPYEIDENLTARSASDKYDKGGFHKFIFGNLYRKDWSTPVSFRKFNLTSEKGGLAPRKIGGGMSSKSIRLRDRDKKEFVLRSVEKGVSKVVPDLFRNSVVQDIFQDQIAASQPYAALVVPPLADAVDVYHTNPEIVYLPAQPGLGDYNKDYGNQLYLFEERPAGNQEDVDDFGNSRKIVSYSQMLDKIRSTSNHHIHQEQVLRSRLLDIFLGDWDRHDDQWRWASFKEEHDDSDHEHTYYEPIPRDRDQVMFRYQGFMPWISKLLSPELRKFQTFGPGIKNLRYLAYNARHFDRSYLNALEKDEWTQIASTMTEQLTDEVIESAVARLPEPIREMRREEYTESFKSRRGQLSKWAEEHYEFLAQYVDVVGTKKDEYFEAKRLPDGNLDVRVFHKDKKGNKEELIYQRLFKKDETREVRLYGLQGDDHFELSGTSRGGPLLRVLGGKGNDEIQDASILKGSGKSVIAYDKISDNGMDPGPDGLDKRSSDYRVNMYDRKEFYYNASIGIPFVSFNPDDGLILSYTHALTTYGFRKAPYKARHNFGMSYATNSAQLSFEYGGHFTDVIGKTDFGMEFFLHLPDNVSNFFGLTNNKTFDANDLGNRDFFRYDQFDIHIHPSLIWASQNQSSRFQFGPVFRYIDVGENNGKFIRDFARSGLSLANFDASSYLGIEADYQLTKIDNPAYPRSGMDFNLNTSYNANLNRSDEKFTRLEAHLTLYNFLWLPKPFVLASRISGGVNWGDFNFNQAHYIGLDQGLRAFRNNRFGGYSSLLFTNDLRVKVGTTRGALPLTFGLMGAYDFGRVWNEGEIDTRWHQSYGGGIFLSPFDIMPISIYYLQSTENTSNLIISLGFSL